MMRARPYLRRQQRWMLRAREARQQRQPEMVRTYVRLARLANWQYVRTLAGQDRLTVTTKGQVTSLS